MFIFGYCRRPDWKVRRVGFGPGAAGWLSLSYSLLGLGICFPSPLTGPVWSPSILFWCPIKRHVTSVVLTLPAHLYQIILLNGCSGDIYDMTSRSHGRMTWSVSDLRNDGIYFLVVGVYMYLVWPRRPYRQYLPPPLHLAGAWCKTSHASWTLCIYMSPQYMGHDLCGAYTLLLTLCMLGQTLSPPTVTSERS